MNTQFREQQPLVIQENGEFTDEPIQVQQKHMHFNERVRLKKNITNLENGFHQSRASSNSFGESQKNMVNFLKMHNYMGEEEFAPDMSVDEEHPQLKSKSRLPKSKTNSVDLKSQLQKNKNKDTQPSQKN